MIRLIKFVTRPWRTRAHMRRSMEILREVRQIHSDAKAMVSLINWSLWAHSFDPSRN